MGDKLDDWVSGKADHDEMAATMAATDAMTVEGFRERTTETVVRFKLKAADGEALDIGPRFVEALEATLMGMRAQLFHAMTSTSDAMLDTIKAEARAEAQEVLDQTE